MKPMRNAHSCTNIGKSARRRILRQKNVQGLQIKEQTKIR
ncbi:hypothetical protein HMPREF3213_01803 [Heyndrickxia coagulans]|uniref:Uncharacterized protein n=1 Tax=Heyndrickxia coagulans TaxID=1398 RepID=A0A133KSB4_HEYCO|nr:hypothetical protein HMPREF3213_01803 [Heyndrickxia coagulans]